MKIKTLLRDVPLWLSVIFGAVIVGGTVFQLMVLVPEYSRDIPSGMIEFARGKIEPGFFWVLVSPLTILLTLITLVTNWRTPRKIWVILGFLTSLGASLLTGIYFMPRLMLMGLIDHNPTTDLELLTRTINEWVFADTLRFVLLILPSFLFFLKALSTPANRPPAPANNANV